MTTIRIATRESKLALVQAHHLAEEGDANHFDLPRPLLDREGCDLSFAGLKTAVRYQLREVAGENDALSDEVKADMAASFQNAACDILQHKTRAAMEMARQIIPDISQLVVAGGVAANQAIGAELQACCSEAGWSLIVPPPKLCTDNAAMIGWAAMERFKAGEVSDIHTVPKARWSLEDLKQAS